MIVFFSGSFSLYLPWLVDQRLIPLEMAAVRSPDETHLALDPAVTYSSVDP
jgi:hypothetical protein